MASRLVHEVHSLIAFGLPYRHIHAKKDAFSQYSPGLRHRRVRHRKYQAFGKTWDFSDPYPSKTQHQVERICRWRGPVGAEEYMVSISHDVDDKSWDFDGMPRAERAAIRKYWESFCAWLVLSPDVLKSWAGVDVVAGRIHRVIDGVEVWEKEPTLLGAYTALRNLVCFLIRCDTTLRDALMKYGQMNSGALSNKRLQPTARASTTPRLKRDR